MRHALQIAMIVRVFKADLDRIMINIADGQLGFYFGHIHGIKLQIGHGSCGILSQGLVDTNADFFSGHKIAGD